MILYVSHRMEEIFALSDAITVFKDGRYVKTFTDMQQVDLCHTLVSPCFRIYRETLSRFRAPLQMARSAYVLML